MGEGDDVRPQRVYFNKISHKQSSILLRLLKQFCFSKYDVIWQQLPVNLVLRYTSFI